MDIYIARQPIFTKNKDIYAYELLFRGGTENYFTGIDGDSATSRVLSNTFFNTGVEQLTSGKRAFINFTKSLLAKKIPLMFPLQFTTIEILEDVAPDEEIIDSCMDFSIQGYDIALDDFEYTPALDPLIDLAKIIKVDFIKSTKNEIAEYCSRFLPRGIKLLAEKVETAREFEEALTMGFTYFQGYFFSKPQVIKETEIPSLKMNLLRIIAEAKSDDFDVSKLQKLIEQDVGISYKLLRYLNSPFFRRVNEISSIRQAIVMLGEKGIRSFLSVIILAELSQDKPDELIKSSVIRARICEKLRLEEGKGPDPSELFTLGLFSHIDAILDNTMENIMKKLPLSMNIKKTLLGEANTLKNYLDLAVNYQNASWEEVSILADKLRINQDKLPSIYFDALGWADSVCSGNQ
jgi:c-di-GMP-related signal transduction protein